MSSFQGVLIRGVPDVLFIEVSSFQGVLIRGVPAVLFIEVSSYQGVLIREVPLYIYTAHERSHTYLSPYLDCMLDLYILPWFHVLKYFVKIIIYMQPNVK